MPWNIFEYFKLYTKGRNNFLENAGALFYSGVNIFSKNKTRILRNGDSKIIAGYTYLFTKNKLDVKRLLIDTIAHDKTVKDPSKDISPLALYKKIIEDIYKTAEKEKVEDVALYVYVKDKKLTKFYETLGFKNNEEQYVEKTWYMTTPLKDFAKKLRDKK